MATNLKLNEHLLERTLALSGRKTKREAVKDALTEFVQRREWLGILEFFDTLDMYESVNDNNCCSRDSQLSTSRLHFEASASLLPRHFSVRYIFLTPVGRFEIWMKPQISNRMYLGGSLDRVPHRSTLE